MRKLMIGLATIAIVTGPAPSIAAPCRDAHGKFVKCPGAKAKSARCRDQHGKFVKCGSKGAKPG